MKSSVTMRLSMEEAGKLAYLEEVWYTLDMCIVEIVICVPEISTQQILLMWTPGKKQTIKFIMSQLI